MTELKTLYNKVQDKSNVIGYSMKLVPRIREGKEIFYETVFRVYVTKKEPLRRLAKKDIIPKKIKGIYTDVVSVDRVEALNTDRTLKLRSVPLASSVGHISITAGSLGMKYHTSSNPFGDLNMRERAGTNAHVVTPDVRIELSDMVDNRICQPGPAHDSSLHIAGRYEWHDRIKSMTENECPASNFVVYALNIISKYLGRTSRFQVSSPLVVNHQDFGTYIPTVQHTLSIPDASLAGKKFIGHLFAGGETIGVICKVKYAIEKGYTPMIEHTEVSLNDNVWGASFWGDYATTVQDTSAAIQVSYKGFVAMFEDVILVKNEGVIKGGWSGGGFYKI